MRNKKNCSDTKTKYCLLPILYYICIFIYYDKMIKVTNIHKSYGKLEVLKGIDLEIKKGEIISIVGASGAGKSTLLHIIGTLDRADTGKCFD